MKMKYNLAKLNDKQIDRFKKDRYDALLRKCPQTYFTEEKKKPRISLKELFYSCAGKKSKQ